MLSAYKNTAYVLLGGALCKAWQLIFSCFSLCALVKRCFPLHSRWTSEEYLRFLWQNGWAVRKSAVLKASFPLTYAECVKSEV